MARSLQQRFDARYLPEPNSGCWLWMGAATKSGYGIMRVDGKTRMATHISFDLIGSARPHDAAFACHTCDVPSCVNPDHLFWGTQHDNMADQKAKGRNHLARRAHCKHGHEFTESNTRHEGRRRVCRACERVAGKRKYLGGPGKGWAKGIRKVAVGERRAVTSQTSNEQR